MKTKVSLKMYVLSVVLLITSFVASARSYDGQLVYNPVEENGVMVGQTVYKMNGNTLANYMKYNYKYDDNKRMIESEIFFPFFFSTVPFQGLAFNMLIREKL